MTKEQQKRITQLLEGKKKDAERCLDNVKFFSNDEKNFISYCEGRLHQANHTF